MKVYEVWIGQYEDCERVYTSTNGSLNSFGFTFLLL